MGVRYFVPTGRHKILTFVRNSPFRDARRASVMSYRAFWRVAMAWGFCRQGWFTVTTPWAGPRATGSAHPTTAAALRSGACRSRGLAQTPGFGGLRSPEGTSLRQRIPESIFSGRMPFYKRTYSPGQLRFITTTSSAPGDWPWSSWRFQFWGNRRPPKTRSAPARVNRRAGLAVRQPARSSNR